MARVLEGSAVADEDVVHAELLRRRATGLRPDLHLRHRTGRRVQVPVSPHEPLLVQANLPEAARLNLAAWTSLASSRNAPSGALFCSARTHSDARTSPLS